ncbi:hypothetical protein NADFUDRAFT_81935, partial [Nadsonia fulvescens var. elongata DSM 6958]
MAKGQKIVFDDETGSAILKSVGSVNSIDSGKKKKRKRTKGNNTNQAVGVEKPNDEESPSVKKFNFSIQELTENNKESTEDADLALNENEDTLLGPLVPEKLLKIHNTDHQFSESELKFKSSEASQENSDSDTDGEKNDDEATAKATVLTRIPYTQKPALNRSSLSNNGHTRSSHFQDSEDEDGESDSDDDEDSRTNVNKGSFRDKTGSVSLDPSSYKEQQRLKHQLLQVRETLPIYGARQELINRISKNQVTVLIGETGSGKSTQLPQFIYDTMNK